MAAPVVGSVVGKVIPGVGGGGGGGSTGPFGIFPSTKTLLKYAKLVFCYAALALISLYLFKFVMIQSLIVLIEVLAQAVMLLRGAFMDIIAETGVEIPSVIGLVALIAYLKRAS